MVSLTLVIGLLNLCLGYALGVHLGFGPSSPDAHCALSETPLPGSQVMSGPPVFDIWRLALATETSKMTTLGDRLRVSEEPPDAETIQECMIELRELCTACLQERGEASDQLAARFGTSDRLGKDGEKLEEAMFVQLAQLETTVSNLRQIDTDLDPSVAAERLSEEIDRMLATGRDLWDGLVTTLSTSPAARNWASNSLNK